MTGVLKNWHALGTCPHSVNATLLPYFGTALTDGQGREIKSQMNGVFAFGLGFSFDLFVLLEVPSRLMFSTVYNARNVQNLHFD